MRTFYTKKPISLDLGLLILRLLLGLCLLTHGWPKFVNILDGNFKFADPLGLGPVLSLVLSAFAEFICSILLVLGFATRWVTIPLIINMSVAFFIVHSADDFATKEKALLYLGGFVTLFLTGPGKFSVGKG